MANLERYYVEFENAYNTDSKKNESLSKLINKIFYEYKEVFESTVGSLKEIGNKKIEVRELDLKIDTIAQKRYKENNEKILYNLNEIR